MNKKIMVVEDEKNIADAIAYALKKEGYITETVYDGALALVRLYDFRPDAIILDVMLPGMDGYDILKKLPTQSSIGVIMLTAKEDIVNKIIGLELGADDYITKPFDMRELLARLKSLLRRIQAVKDSPKDDLISSGEIVLYPNERTAYVEGRPLDLTPKEYDVLSLLLSNPNRVYSREQLLEIVWGIGYVGGTRTVDIHIQRLRRKLGEKFANLIQTVHGIGYKVVGGNSDKQNKG